MGAENDPRAPYNQKSKTVSVLVSFTCYKTIDVEVDGPYDEFTLKELADEATYEERRRLWAEDWEEDEFTVIEN